MHSPFEILQLLRVPGVGPVRCRAAIASLGPKGLVYTVLFHTVPTIQLLRAPSRFGLDTQCTNCHSQIHGSNFHPRFLR